MMDNWVFWLGVLGIIGGIATTYDVFSMFVRAFKKLAEESSKARAVEIFRYGILGGLVVGFLISYLIDDGSWIHILIDRISTKL